MTKTEIYSDFLTTEGYRPSLDKDGDLTFKHERINFILFANEKDEEFFKLMIPFFWPIESEEERERAARVMHRLNAEYKAAKFYPIDGDVCVCVECFFETPEHFKKVFGRCIDLLAAAMREFRQHMREETPSKPPLAEA